jgi:hypothetical protein
MIRTFLNLFLIYLVTGICAVALSAQPVVNGLKLADPELEITLWADSPLLANPTNFDVDTSGRIWVTEGVNYRRSKTRDAGDQVVVLEDTDLDGVADKSTVFVQDPYLVAPMGIGVIGNQIYVSQTPDIIRYTDVNQNLVFDEGDTREVFLTGFIGSNHDHSTHSVIGGPDGKLYFNQGNCGAKITDGDGKTFYVGSFYYNKGGPQVGWNFNPTTFAGKQSDDGHVWVSGFTGRIDTDGTGMDTATATNKSSHPSGTCFKMTTMTRPPAGPVLFRREPFSGFVRRMVNLAGLPTASLARPLPKRSGVLICRGLFLLAMFMEAVLLRA